MSIRTARTVLCVSTLAALMLAVHPVAANEPEGLIQFVTEGMKEAPEGSTDFHPGERAVTLIIRSTRNLQGAVLVHEAPAVVSQRLARLSLPGAPSRLIDPHDGKSPAVIDLGPLAAGVPVTLVFAESFAEGSGGVVSFTVEAVTGDGKVFRESHGQVVGTPGVKPVIRDGLIEYPAHEEPTEEIP